MVISSRGVSSVPRAFTFCLCWEKKTAKPQITWFFREILTDHCGWLQNNQWELTAVEWYQQSWREAVYKFKAQVTEISMTCQFRHLWVCHAWYRTKCWQRTVQNVHWGWTNVKMPLPRECNALTAHFRQWSDRTILFDQTHAVLSFMLWFIPIAGSEVLLRVSIFSIKLFVKFLLSLRWKINEPFTSDISKLILLYY